MNRNHLGPRAFVCAAGVALGAAAAHAQSPREFAWRAPVQVPAGASVARIEVPPAALARLQSADARDLRVFNAAGEPVAFALREPVRANPAPPAPRTRVYEALPLYSAAPGALQAKGSMQVRIDEAGAQRSVWVQLGGGDIGSGRKLDSVLFATVNEEQSLGGLDVQAALPANTPVRVSASSSADLAQWTALPVRGRLYRFAGAGAPVNTTLEFDAPVKLAGRYLRLDWTGQDGVAVSGVAGILAAPVPPPARVRAELSTPQPADGGAVEIDTGFRTPLAALALATPNTNALLPVRILGRSDASQPWRLLGQTVVYRLGPAASEAVNPSVPLHGASALRLRIESTNGSDLARAQLQAGAEFEPLRLVFVATGAGPFELAAGRADTKAAALPLDTIAAALGGRKLDDLPAAAVGTGLVQAAGEAGLLARWWPGREAPGRAAVLWAVLIAGVMLLGAVAWSLLRQLKQPAPPRP